jgi:hypothetical protein
MAAAVVDQGRRELKRKTAVAGRVFVTAGEAGACAAQKHRAGCQDGAPGCRAVIERTGQNERNGRGGVLFLETLILGATGAEDVEYVPTVAARDARDPRGSGCTRTLLFAKRGIERRTKIMRNVQQFSPSPTVGFRLF